MSKKVNKFLFAGYRFFPKTHLRQPGFTYNACGPFIKNKERIQKFKETGNSRYIYQNELDKPCFQYDMAYGYFKDLTIEEQLLIKYCVLKYLILLKIQKLMDSKRVLLQ